MSIDRLNAMPAEDVRPLLFNCCGSEVWVDRVLSRRPFKDREALFKLAEKEWHQCGEADCREAFSQHPKIGDLESLEKKFASTKKWAGGEQAGVRTAQKETLEALARCNREYEEKFGYIFIVCATGKSAKEMLRIISERLENDPEKEIKIAMIEQQKITRLRLEKLLKEW